VAKLNKRSAVKHEMPYEGVGRRGAGGGEGGKAVTHDAGFRGATPGKCQKAQEGKKRRSGEGSMGVFFYILGGSRGPPRGEGNLLPGSVTMGEGGREEGRRKEKI